MTPADRQQVSLDTPGPHPGPLGDPGLDLLASLLGSRARATVLRFFMLDPSRAFYQRQIEHATGLPIRAVQRELERFTEMRLLYRYAEGNRAYYQVDRQFLLYPELREAVLKTAAPLERLRGRLTASPLVRQAFYDPERERVLVVLAEGAERLDMEPGEFETDVVTSGAFVATLSERATDLAPFLAGGVDLLGRRDDVLWRRIEAAGFKVPREQGVA